MQGPRVGGRESRISRRQGRADEDRGSTVIEGRRAYEDAPPVQAGARRKYRIREAMVIVDSRERHRGSDHLRHGEQGYRWSGQRRRPGDSEKLGVYEGAG